MNGPHRRETDILGRKEEERSKEKVNEIVPTQAATETVPQIVITRQLNGDIQITIAPGVQLRLVQEENPVLNRGNLLQRLFRTFMADKGEQRYNNQGMITANLSNKDVADKSVLCITACNVRAINEGTNSEETDNGKDGLSVDKLDKKFKSLGLGQEWTTGSDNELQLGQVDQMGCQGENLAEDQGQADPVFPPGYPDPIYGFNKRDSKNTPKKRRPSQKAQIHVRRSPRIKAKMS